ncbi:MAG: phenylalanine--tRNA ligase subunit beta, partial [Eubacteriales bacterium]|nr:phenylalanine--tRNA ligase subunit beta [Eubacteriales bacterium]
SEIKDTTETVVFESANFNGPSVRLTSRALGMRTESSGRFEKGLDAEITERAVQRACELVELLGAGEVVSGVADVYKNKRETTCLPLEAERINSLIGVENDAGRMKDILRSLGFEVEGDMIRVPSFRADVECGADIAEEIIRISGYDTIVPTPFRGSVRTGRFAPRQAYRHRLNDLLCTLGLSECYTFSFIPSAYYDKIGLAAGDPLRRSLAIRNPLGEDTAIMRIVILPSLLESLARNENFGAEEAALYETAAVYIPGDGGNLPAEPLQTAIALYGGDFYRMKGIVEAVLEDAQIDAAFAACRDNPTWHPGRCATVTAPDGGQLAVFGQLHPKIAENYGFDREVYAATLYTEEIYARADFTKKFTPLPRYPAAVRDLAFVCDEEREAGEFMTVIREAGGELTGEITLFDVYRGAQLPEGKKSLAFTVAFRAPDRTLTDTEAEEAKHRIIAAVESRLGAALRN